MPEPKPIFSILHLSDLHLGANFADVGGKKRGFLRALLKEKSFVQQAHDDLLLLLLPLEINRIGIRNRSRVQNAWQGTDATPSFDRIVVTGDISTDATSTERFRFAHSFLSSKMPLADGLYGPQASIGLDLPNELLLCIPGNHDKMRQTTLEMFNSSFSHSPQPCNYVQIVKRFGKALILIGMDSNAYDEGNIANGEMDQGRLSWLTTQLDQMQTNGITAGQEKLTAEECSAAIKCLLVHHHVCDLSVRHLFNLERSFTTMRGSKSLLKLISGKIQVVFHGHEHYPTHFFERESGVLIVSAGTASQWQTKPYSNSFYNLVFYSDDTLQIEELVWNGKGFTSREHLNGMEQPPRYPLRQFESNGA